MHSKIKNIFKKTALLLTLGFICITAVSIGKTQNIQAADHIYKNKTFHVYAEHAVRIESYYSDDNISQSKKTEWNNDNGCNVKANEYKQLEETLDANDKLFVYIGYSFTGIEMEVKFDQHKFNVAYDLNGGQGTNSTQEGKFNRAKTGVTLHGAPSRTGYQFTKWKCNRTEDDGEYSAGSSYYPKDWKNGHLLNSIIMTAQWDANKYYVTYKPNKPGNASHDVTGTMPAKTEFKYDTGKELDNNQYNLTGWNTKAAL